MVTYRRTTGSLPPRNFLLPVADAIPERGIEWSHFIDTWTRYDLDPNTKPSDYPLWRWHYNKYYYPDKSVEYVEDAIATYAAIKAGGFVYTDHRNWIMRAYGPPWNHVHTGHIVISILRHLEPDAIVEVAGYDTPPPQQYR